MNHPLHNLVFSRFSTFLTIVGMAAGSAVYATPCIVPDAAGTADLPPIGCTYTTPDNLGTNDLFIINGLPPATVIQMDSNLHSFVGVVQTPGGGLGGETQSYQASLDMPMIGQGALLGFNRNIVLPLSFVQSHSAPRIPGTTPQVFVTDMFQMQGQITGDPDFDLLRVTGGSGFGLPSPGSTTLTRLGPPGSNWNVDSYFDITYRIDFVGRAGGALSGQSGSTTGTARFVIGAIIPEPGSIVLALMSSFVFICRHRQEAAFVSTCI